MRRRGERDRADAESKPQQKTEKKTMRRGMAGRKPIGESFPPSPESKQLDRPYGERKKEEEQNGRSSLSRVFSIIHRNPATSGRHGFRGPRVPHGSIPLLSFIFPSTRSFYRTNKSNEASVYIEGASSWSTEIRGCFLVRMHRSLSRKDEKERKMPRGRGAAPETGKRTGRAKIRRKRGEAKKERGGFRAQKWRRLVRHAECTGISKIR